MKNKLKFLSTLAFLSIGVANAQVGVGTTSPDTSSMLDINSTSKGLLAPKMTTSQRNLIVSPANGLIVFNTTTNQLEINTGSTTVPSWTSAGAVPNATTTATGIVQLAGDLAGTATVPSVAANAITSAKIAEATVANVDLAVGVGGIYKGSGSLSGATTVTQGANALNFSGTGVTTFNSGNVGIGITTPNAPLQFATTIQNRKIALYDNFNNDHQFYGLGVNGGMLRYQIDSNLSSTSHAWFAGSTATTSVELMRLTGIGNLGIGTATPSERLDVAGNIDFSGALMPNNLAGTTGQVLTSAGAGVAPTWSSLSATNTPNIYTADGTFSGNRTVTQGANTLTFIGSGAINKYSNSATGIALFNIGRVTTEADFGVAGSPGQGFTGTAGGDAWIKSSNLNFFAGTLGNANVNLMTNNAARLTVTGGGNVGIGTTLPVARLDVASVVNNNTYGAKISAANYGGTIGQQGALLLENVNSYWGPSLTFNNTFASDGAEVDFRHLGTSVGSINYDNSGTYYTGAGYATLSSNQIATINTANVERVRVLANGNVGIGTTVPNAPLQLANTLGNRKIVLWEQANNDNQFYGLGINGGTLRFQIDATTALYTWNAAVNATSSNEVMRLTGAGNLGIGTNNPQYKLHVNNGDAVVTGGCFVVGSDIRIKKDIEPYVKGLETLIQLNPVRYHFTKDYDDTGKRTQVGLIAQEVQLINPEMVQTTDSPNGLLTLRYQDLSILSINAFKQIYQQFKELKDENKILKEKLENIQIQLDNLSKKLK